MRHTSGHTRNRRSHHALKVARFETCKDCNTKHLMHRACTNCGKYRGRLVIDTLKKTVKAAKKKGETAATSEKPAKKATPAKKPAAKKAAKSDKE